MKIGVISDTHTYKLPAKIVKVFKDCDMILHAGDLIDWRILEDLKEISKVEAVRGNMDSPRVKSMLPDKKTLNICGKKLCLIHGYGKPDSLIEILKKEFSVQKPDIIVFGHSHVPMNKYIDGTLFFNPGSPTDTIFAPYKSYGIIEITGGAIKADIYKLNPR